MPKNAPAVIDEAGVLEVRKDYPAMRSALAVMANEAEQADTSGNVEEFVMDIGESVLAAESIEDVFAAQDKSGMIAGKDFVNRPFYLASENITIVKSAKENGFPFYAIMRVIEIATGEEVVLNCGGKTIMPVIFRLQQLGFFDPTEENPYGAAVVILAKAASGDNAYLLLAPFKVAVPSNAKKRA
jgi:hypothetical protein